MVRKEWAYTHELKSPTVAGVSQLDNRDPVLRVEDDITKCPFQLDLLAFIEIADEHGVLQGVSEALDAGMDRSEPPVVADVICDQVPSPSHGYLVVNGT